MEWLIALPILVIGWTILLIGYVSLTYWLPRKAKDVETILSIQALKACFWLVVFGLAIVFLGLLYLADLVPPPNWWDRILPS